MRQHESVRMQGRQGRERREKSVGEGLRHARLVGAAIEDVHTKEARQKLAG